LDGGKTNLNLLLQIDDVGACVVRRYLRDPDACGKELGILRSLHGRVPVPEIVEADVTGQQAGEPYILYRYVHGMTFRELRDRGSVQDCAQAAYALGKTLARIGHVWSDGDSSTAGLGPRCDSSTLRFDTPVHRDRLGDDVALVRELAATWAERLAALCASRTLVHGDFNQRNIVFDRNDGRWEVAGILDWENACTGSPLWDAARFVCYEKPESPCCEPSFSDGFRHEGGHLPEDWTTFSHVINTISAADSLGRADLRPEFIPELRELAQRRLHAPR
jgi:fructokinase